METQRSVPPNKEKAVLPTDKLVLANDEVVSPIDETSSSPDATVPAKNVTISPSNASALPTDENIPLTAQIGPFSDAPVSSNGEIADPIDHVVPSNNETTAPINHVISPPDEAIPPTTETVISSDKIELQTKETALPIEDSQTWHALAEPWRKATLAILPTFLITRFIFLLLSYFGGVLFFVKNYVTTVIPFHDIVYRWNWWDAKRFATIATQGYP